MLELPYCNADNFQIFLDELSQVKPDELKVLVLDNGAFHKAKSLKIPDNIILLFLPPYSPELNPAEKIWAKFKRDFTNKLFSSLDELRSYVCNLANKLSSEETISICSYKYVFLNPYWTKI